MEYRIGDFSLITRFPVKTLRYYHEIGLLEPTRVDEVSGYRYYDESQVERARAIAVFKQLELDLESIRELLDRVAAGKDISAELEARREEVRGRIRDLIEVDAGLARLGAAGAGVAPDRGRPQGAPPRAGTVTKRKLPGELVVSHRFTGRYADAGERFPELARAAGPHVAGAPFALCFQDEYVEDGADIELCLPTSRVVDAPDTTSRVVEAVTAYVTVHVGPFESIGESYGRLFEHLAARGIEHTVPIRERYLHGPGAHENPGPSEYLTELAVPVEPAPACRDTPAVPR